MVRRLIRTCLLLMAVCLLASCSSSRGLEEDEMGPKYKGPLPVVQVVTPPSNNPACRQGDPLANVYHPQRLQIIQRCILVTGSVTMIRHESDGDYHVDVNLDPPYADLINERNRTAQSGALVVEIIPADRTTVNVPRAGDHVEIIGPYVLDKDHGWMEIHPVWSLRVLQ